MSDIHWIIHREGRKWTREESQQRMYAAPEKIEFVRGIFASDQQRFTVLGMLLETLGIDRVVKSFGNADDWKAAAAARLESEGQADAK